MTLTQITEKGIKDGEIVNADINASAAIAKSKLASLDIVNADINASAAIAKSKLASLDIVNADINASAAIAGSKINPSFTSNITIGTTTPSILLADGSGRNVELIGGSSSTGPELRTAYAEDLRFGTNSLERMRIDSSGRVLIGLTANAANASIDDLQVGNPNSNNQSGITIGSNDEGAIAFANNGDARAGSITYNMGSDAFIFKTDGQNERMRIDSSGNVGIGTTSPAEQLVVMGSGNPTIRIQETASGTGKRLDLGVTDSGAVGFIGANQSASKLAFQTVGSERMRIDSTGKVGIGTTTPGQILHLDSGGSTTQIQIDSDTESSISFNDHGGSPITYHVGTNISDNNGQFEIRDVTNSASRVRISSSGNVGIGTASPSYPFHVKGLTAYETTNSTNKWVNYTYTDNSFRFNYNGAGNDEIIFPSTGGITFTGGTAAANTLDSYEEGTFTPDWQGTNTGGTTTYVQNHGSYTKIGNTVDIRIYSSVTGTTATGSWIMHNLPFIGANNLSAITTGSCMIDFLDFNNSYNWIVPYKNMNTNDFDLYANGDNAGWSVVQIAADSSFSIIMGLTYQAA